MRAALALWAAWATVAALAAPAAAQRARVPGPATFEATAPANDDGTHIDLTIAPMLPELSYLLLRREGAATAAELAATLPAHGRLSAGEQLGPWTLLAVVDEEHYEDTVPDPGAAYTYAVVAAMPAAVDDVYEGFAVPVLAGPIRTVTSWFDTTRWFFLVIVIVMAGALAWYMGRARHQPEDMYVRRIPGVDAIEEAVGRSTEMGRPVLYVTGVEEIQNIQTIASLLILGHVAEMTAEYDTDIKVANFFPLTMVVAEEIVKQGYANAGRIDAHKPENVMFISAEQFAFAAGVNGLILRDKPATNIYLGRFFAESLILAETGYVTRAIQIAGTAEITQLPFFIAACDYTIIGEELYAVGAYLSREPLLLAQLKATDLLKLLIMIAIVVGVLGATAGWFDLGGLLLP